jgi:hypothetical protein
VGLWERWTSVYHRRVGITVEVERVIVWPDRRCAGAPSMHGAPLPADPPAPQDPPAKGTGPRIAHRRAARRAARRPEVLLAWVGADGFPVVAPVRIAGAEHDGIVLEAAPGIDLPPGGRRAGLLAHAFARYTHGQHQHQHTGWLENRVGRLLYAPHTKHGYWMPRSEAIFRFASGAMTRYGHRGGVRAGFLPG